jgi:hypothetical protein
LIKRLVLEEHEITCRIIQARREHIDCCTELGTCFGLFLKYRLDTRK